jgi:DNA anti-recombination protein RmuC
MILQYQTIEKENVALKNRVKDLNDKVNSLEKQLSQAHGDYNSLKMARMISISDGDIDGAKKRVQKLMRDVNKCITLLSEK